MRGKASTGRAVSPKPKATTARAPKAGATPVRSPPTKKCKATRQEQEEDADAVPKSA